jgi:tetratricopeptide (TPR) repeat protein
MKLKGFQVLIIGCCILHTVSPASARTSTLTDAQLSAYLTHSDELSRQGKYAESEAILLTALREAQRTPGSATMSALISNNLGYLYHSLGRCDDARTFLLRAARLWRDAGDSLHLIRAGNNLISVYVECGDAAGAVRFWRAVMEPMLPSMGPDSTERAALLAEGGAVELASRQDRKAETLLSDAIAIFERIKNVNTNDLALSLSNRATARAYLGRPDEALADATRAVTLLEHRDVDPLLIATIRNNVGLASYLTGHPAEADQSFKEALASLAQTPDCASTVPLLRNYAVVLRKTGRGKEAKALEQRANAIARGNPTSNHRYTVDASEIAAFTRGR